jgi:hypothetical protein
MPHIARAVAECLGDAWQATDGPFGPDTAELTGPDHQRIELSALGDRWHAQARYPHTRHGLPHGLTWPKITVTARRGAEVLAAEITRRLLPGYLTQLKEVLDFQSEAERDEQAQQQAAERIVGLLPGDVRRLDFDTSRIIWYLPGHEHCRADVCLSRDGTQMSKLELERLPLDAGVQLLEFLAELTEPSHKTSAGAGDSTGAGRREAGRV